MTSTSFTSYLTTKLLFPLYHTLKGDGLWPIVREYERSQWYSLGTLRKLQQEKLLLLLLHCERNVPYYQEMLKYNGLTAEDCLEYKNFLKLPFLTKNNINNNRDKFIASDVKKSDLIPSMTSGSTGESLYFYFDKKSGLHRQAVLWRNQEWVNCLYTDRQAFLWGAPFDIEKAQSMKGRLHALFNRNITLSSSELSDEAMANYLTILNKYKPSLLVSYPSPLATFSEFLLARNETIPSIRSLITSAETLYPWQRALIESVFNCPVFDRYGCREFGNIAHECITHEGYHVNIERFFLEILDPHGNPVPEGETGDIYITDLDNYGFPLLRYRIGDMAVPTNSRCSCGRGLPLLHRLEGRSFDIIIAPNGNRIAGTFWSIALKSILGVKNFQLEQFAIDNIIIRIVPGFQYSPKSEKELIHLIKDKCGYEMHVQIIYLDDIPLTNSGKRKFIISHISEN